MADGFFETLMADMSDQVYTIDSTMSKAQIDAMTKQMADLTAESEAREKACTANTACTAMAACLDKMDAPSGSPGDCSKGTTDAGPTAAEKKKALIDAAKKVADEAKKAKDNAQTAVTAACGSRRSARATHVAARKLCNDVCDTDSALLEAAGTTVQACKDGCQADFELAATVTTTTESAACTAARKDLKDAEDAHTKAEAAVDDAASDSDSAATAAASVLAMAVAAAATFV